MIAHTRQFPTTPTTTNMESTVVMTTLAGPDMINMCQPYVSCDLTENKIIMRLMIVTKITLVLNMCYFQKGTGYSLQLTL